MSDRTSSQTIAAIERAADVLSAFVDADGESLGVTELAQRLSLSKAVVHRILASLKGRDLIEVDEETRRYSLGPGSLALGLTYLQRIDVRDLARGFLRELSEATAETATLSIRRGQVRIYVDQVTPAREVKMIVQLGHPYPLHAGSSSKAFLAYLPQEAIDEYLAGPLDSLTDLTVTDISKLRTELARIRRRGYATSTGERQTGAASLAAPVFDHEASVAAVISVCGPRERFRREFDQVAPIVLMATTRLSRQLGWDGELRP